MKAYKIKSKKTGLYLLRSRWCRVCDSKKGGVWVNKKSAITMLGRMEEKAEVVEYDLVPVATYQKNGDVTKCMMLL